MHHAVLSDVAAWFHPALPAYATVTAVQTLPRSCHYALLFHVVIQLHIQRRHACSPRKIRAIIASLPTAATPPAFFAARASTRAPEDAAELPYAARL